MAKNHKSFFWFIAVSIVFASCKKDTPAPEPPVISSGKGVFIVNEGNFMWSNASITYYNFENQAATEDIFSQVNGRPLGDVAQSITLFNNRIYIVVNNSSKIEIVNLSDFSSTAVITGLNSPRYFLPVNNNKAYVTDLYSNTIHIIDLNSNTKIGSINCKGSTEEMILKDNTVITTNTRTNFVYLIDVTTDKIIDSIQVGFASNSLVEDKNGKVWVMCAGDMQNSINASIHKINFQNKQVEQSFNLGVALDIWDKIRINLTKDTIYYMCKGIYRMPVSSGELPQTVFISQGNRLFHGLGINPFTRHIYVADAIDYVQKGKVYCYSADGTLLNTIPTGVIPVDFLFY